MLSKLRARARLLLRQVRSDEPARVRAAAARFARLSTLAGCAGDPSRVAQRVRLKHALTVIALEHGHRSWPALKSALERAPAEAVVWYPRGMGAFLNRWFARYEDARRSLETEGGFLFPYRDQFFVCEAGALAALGLDADDPDFMRVDRDCARPRDRDAYDRLRRRREARGDTS